jgi:hypothetical protein
VCVSHTSDLIFTVSTRRGRMRSCHNIALINVLLRHTVVDACVGIGVGVDL